MSVDSELPNKLLSSDVKEDNTKVVANHYNAIKEKGLESRFKSPIFYMRNFNNWVKGILINDYLKLVKEKTKGEGPIVLDLCCGKGGDLFKWDKGNVKHVVCADIAQFSISDCSSRYDALKKKSGYRRLFTAEFVVADCTNDVLGEKFKDPNIQFDMVSCQFACHYSFESLGQAERMMENISSNLKYGGYFIGTIPDAYDIVQRAQKSIGNSFGNEVFKIDLQFDPKEGYPLFGAKYNFHLEGVVDCPEFLVHFPTFIELAKKYDLQLKMKERFQDFFEKNKEEGMHLLQKMLCFKSYSATNNSDDDFEFSHAQKYIADKNIESVGTISKSEWEAASIYLVFAFEKVEKKGKE